MEHQVADRMVKAFQLTPSQIAELRRSDEPMTPDFFSALAKAQQIHQQCKQLLNRGHQVTAFEIMEQMAIYQEAGLERLYRWTQNQCRNVDSSEPNVLLTRAMTCLQERPILLK